VVFLPIGTPKWYTDGVEDVARHPRLQKRGSRYFLRVKVPPDLRSAVGKREIRRALGTSEPREALKRVRQASAETDAMFEALRGKVIATVAALAPASAVDLDRIVRQEFYEMEIQRLNRISEADEHDTEDILEVLRVDEAILSSGYNASTSFAASTADELLKKNRLHIDQNSPEYWRFVDKVLRAELEIVQRSIEKVRGNPREPRFDRLFADIDVDNPPSSGGVTLRELIERYESDPARRGLTEKTRQAYGTVFRALRELLGESKRARDITREDCRRVQEILCSLPPNASKRLPGLTLEQAAATATQRGWPPLHHKTATNYLNNLSALFNWAVEEGHVEKNPARALKVAAPPGSAKSRLPFSTDQLVRIFNAPRYLASAGNIESRDGRFWVPLLSLWTGMRLNEVVQLRTDDITVLDGVNVILIRADEEGDKRLKTNASERFVPIHSELKKMGFLTYVMKIKSAGEVRLFPELPKGKRGYYSDPFQKWFSRFLTQIGAKTPKTSFHSFRHCFRDALRDADISTERVRALGGWTSKGGAEEIYGTGHRASTLAKEIEKLRYPGLNLSHLYL
jgi:integrase